MAPGQDVQEEEEYWHTEDYRSHLAASTEVLHHTEVVVVRCTDYRVMYVSSDVIHGRVVLHDRVVPRDHVGHDLVGQEPDVVHVAVGWEEEEEEPSRSSAPHWQLAVIATAAAGTFPRWGSDMPQVVLVQCTLRSVVYWYIRSSHVPV
jgi:hypothetical protein